MTLIEDLKDSLGEYIEFLYLSDTGKEIVIVPKKFIKDDAVFSEISRIIKSFSGVYMCPEDYYKGQRRYWFVPKPKPKKKSYSVRFGKVKK